MKKLNERQENGQYKDDVYMEISDEKEQIRKALGMYIGAGETEGALHTIKELTNNAIDECVNPESPSKKIYITFNEDKCEFTVTDEGRGIPFDILAKISTQKHTSTKFVRSEPWMKGQAGRNGVGIVVTAALSDYMSLTSYRKDKYKVVEFVDGEMVEHEPEKNKKHQTGLSVKLIPSEKYLGKIDLGIELIEDFLRRMTYLLPEDVSIDFYGESPKYNGPIKRKYIYQGLQESVNFLSSSLEFEPINIEYIEDDFDLLLSFSYDKSLDEMIMDSYCNYVHSREGGTHETTVQRALCEFFTREARKLDPNSKYEVSYEDCKKGLIAAINLRHIDPGYEGQTKTKVNNKDVLQSGKRGLNKALYQYFNNNNALLRKIISYLRQISKIRMEAHKIKGIPMKKHTTFLDDADLKIKFYNISNRNYSGYKELIITEGDSAQDSIDNARNKINQAICAVMGVTDNVHGLTVAQMLQKQVFKDIITILGCGIGKDFDINKLKYNKIIIMTDADVDGDNITSSLLSFFFLFLRPLIEEGYIYKALPPLYVIDPKQVKKYYKGDPWLFDKKEYYELFNNIISNNVVVAINTEDGVQKLKKKELQSWLELNAEYLLELDSLVKRTAGNPLILEYVCYYKIVSMGDEEKFKKLIETEFNELKYDIYESSLVGSYEGTFVSLITDNLFMRISERFISLLSENPSFFIYSRNKNEKDDKYDKITIGQFLNEMERSFNIKIDQRFKGLGEAPTETLFVTTLNPKIRRLMRMNVFDVKEALDMFTLLHGKSNENREQRRELLEKTKILYSDIDN